jgi:hypothetical protein
VAPSDIPGRNGCMGAKEFWPRTAVCLVFRGACRSSGDEGGAVAVMGGRHTHRRLLCRRRPRSGLRGGWLLIINHQRSH